MTRLISQCVSVHLFLTILTQAAIVPAVRVPAEFRPWVGGVAAVRDGHDRYRRFVRHVHARWRWKSVAIPVNTVQRKNITIQACMVWGFKKNIPDECKTQNNCWKKLFLYKSHQPFLH